MTMPDESKDDGRSPMFVCAKAGCLFKRKIDMTKLSESVPLGAGTWTILTYRGNDAAREQRMTFCPPCQIEMEKLVVDQLFQGAAQTDQVKTEADEITNPETPSMLKKEGV